VSNVWKQANISHINKKDSKTKANNYPPVSLTSQICKVWVFHQGGHSRSSKEEQKEHHGFRQGKSALINLLEYLEDITKAVDKKHPVDIKDLDCIEAFDTIPHMRLAGSWKVMGSGKIYCSGLGASIPTENKE